MRTSPPVFGWLDRTCAAAAAQAGDGFEWSTRVGRKNPQGRGRGIVYAATYAARRRNANENTLVRVLGSVRA
ncbi:hypothetical protein [Rhodococcus koreensis]|uniref:hypothetical protein n=1 Tax=Rhodococcus koreensis TaxID=99653 RepID=UPI0036DD6824